VHGVLLRVEAFLLRRGRNYFLKSKVLRSCERFAKLSSIVFSVKELCWMSFQKYASVYLAFVKYSDFFSEKTTRRNCLLVLKVRKGSSLMIFRPLPQVI